MEAELADMNSALDQIQTEPTDAQSMTMEAKKLPKDIPSQPDDDLLIHFQVEGDAEVRYVKLRHL